MCIRDRDYTSGAKVAWSSPNVRSFADDECLPQWLQEAGKLFTRVYSPSVDQGNVTFTLGQAFYTPRDAASAALIPTDRPYAGCTYIGFGYNTRSARRLDSYEVNLGVVGPWSHAKEVQDFIHKLRGFDQFQGWKNQLGNEFGAQLVFERKYRTEFHQFADRRDGFGFDIIPHYGLSLGNVAVSYTHLDVYKRQAPRIPRAKIKVAESGLSTNADLRRLAGAGVTCFLVGESLMRQSDVAAATRKLLQG